MTPARVRVSCPLLARPKSGKYLTRKKRFWQGGWQGRLALLKTIKKNERTRHTKEKKNERTRHTRQTRAFRRHYQNRRADKAHKAAQTSFLILRSHTRRIKIIKKSERCARIYIKVVCALRASFSPDLHW